MVRGKTKERISFSIFYFYIICKCIQIQLFVRKENEIWNDNKNYHNDKWKMMHKKRDACDLWWQSLETVMIRLLDCCMGMKDIPKEILRKIKQQKLIEVVMRIMTIVSMLLSIAVSSGMALQIFIFNSTFYLWKEFKRCDRIYFFL